MKHLEKCAYPVIWKCNLSCHGCANYSNHALMSKEPLSDWRNDFELFSSQFKVDKFYIVGGEPLLNPELKDIINATLKFSNKVQLVTNGLLLSEHEWLYELLRKNENFDIYISYHQSKERLGKTKYDEMFFESVGKFLKTDSNKIQNRIESFKNIIMKNGVPIVPRVVVGLTFQEWRITELDKDDIPVPCNSNYIKAKIDFCHCPVPHLYKKKIYKCHVTALLPDLLQKYHKYDDAWNALKNYCAYDLEHPSDHYKKLTKPEPVCSICPDSSDKFITEKKDKYSKIINITVA